MLYEAYKISRIIQMINISIRDILLTLAVDGTVCIVDSDLAVVGNAVRFDDMFVSAA